MCDQQRSAFFELGECTPLQQNMVARCELQPDSHVVQPDPSSPMHMHGSPGFRLRRNPPLIASLLAPYGFAYFSNALSIHTAVESPMQRPAAGKSFVLDQVLVASTSDDQLQHFPDSKAATQSLRSPASTGFDVEATESDTHASLTKHANRAPSANQSSNTSIQDHRTQEGSASPLLRAPGALATSYSQACMLFCVLTAKRHI